MTATAVRAALAAAPVPKRIGKTTTSANKRVRQLRNSTLEPLGIVDSSEVGLVGERGNGDDVSLKRLEMGIIKVVGKLLV